MSDHAPLLGHDGHVRHFLDAIGRDRLHHAYLFEGPRGVGKHTVARWLAKAATCPTTDGPPPCGVCPTCSRVDAGVHPDVVTLTPDAGKATPIITVQQVREVVRLAGFHRFEAARRVVIIDPAEAMQASAANALLKTLEEPPAGTHFILIAAHASSLLPTIVSRCQRVRFSPVPEAELAAWLTAQGIGDATRLARVAQGRPGSALAMAEGAWEDRTNLRDEVLAIVGGDLKAIFAFSEQHTKGSRATWMPQVEAVLETVEELLRDVCVLGSGSDAALLHDDARPVLTAWSRVLWPGGVATCEDALDDARRDLALNVTGKTALDALFTALATELGPARTAGRR